MYYWGGHRIGSLAQKNHVNSLRVHQWGFLQLHQSPGYSSFMVESRWYFPHKPRQADFHEILAEPVKCSLGWVSWLMPGKETAIGTTSHDSQETDLEGKKYHWLFGTVVQHIASWGSTAGVRISPPLFSNWMCIAVTIFLWECCKNEMSWNKCLELVWHRVNVRFDDHFFLTG